MFLAIRKLSSYLLLQGSWKDPTSKIRRISIIKLWKSISTNYTVRILCSTIKLLQFLHLYILLNNSTYRVVVRVKCVHVGKTIQTGKTHCQLSSLVLGEKLMWFNNLKKVESELVYWIWPWKVHTKILQRCLK